jgi:predicted dehydrogenase
MAKVRWALLGLDHHYTALNMLKSAADNNATLAAVWHRNADQLAEATKGMDVQLLDRWETAVEDPSIDLIVSCSNTALNQEILARALENKKNAISVKPMAMTVDDANRLTSLAKKNGVVLISFESSGRLAGLNQYILRLIEDGTIGKVLSVTGIAHSRLPKAWPDGSLMGGSLDDGVGPGWWEDPNLVPGGGWIDHAIYQTDLARWWTGTDVVKAVGYEANVKHPAARLEDYGVGVLEFASGAVANLEHTWHVRRAGPGSGYLEILGENGAVVTNGFLDKLAVTEVDGHGWTYVEKPAGRASIIDHVVEVMKGKADLVANGEDAKRNLAACLAVYESAKTGKPIKL